jgi:hypothetical protein
MTWLLGRLWIVAIVISIASSPGDGGYLARFLPAAFAYGFNFAVDAATELAGYAFVTIQRDGSVSKRRRWLSWLLLPFQFGMLYYAIVFAHAEFATTQPDTAPYLLWSLASFGPAALTGLGIAQAVIDTKKRTRKSNTEPKQSEPKPEPVPVLAFDCPVCLRSFGTQNALNGHMSKHRANGNGTHPQRERVEAEG